MSKFAKMYSIFKAAAKAKGEGNDTQALLLLKKGLEAYHTVLSIQSPKISEQQRAILADFISSCQRLYQSEFIAQMSEDDCELLVLVLMSWKGLNIGGTHLAIDEVINMFEIAKSRLGTDEGVIGPIYNSDYVPAPLRDIMQSFLAGEATQEETEKRLDECTTKLREWMSELFFRKPFAVH